MLANGAYQMLSNFTSVNVYLFPSTAVMCYGCNYDISGSGLRVVETIKDLCVVSSLLGYLHISTRSPLLPLPLVTLYKSLSRAIMEYCSVIWSPYQAGHIDLLNSIQIRYFRLLGLMLGFRFLDTPIADLVKQFDI